MVQQKQTPQQQQQCFLVTRGASAPVRVGQRAPPPLPLLSEDNRAPCRHALEPFVLSDKAERALHAGNFINVLFPPNMSQYFGNSFNLGGKENPPLICSINP